jgi:tetratricopeptide (TPR) repeat protein
VRAPERTRAAGSRRRLAAAAALLVCGASLRDAPAQEQGPKPDWTELSANARVALQQGDYAQAANLFLDAAALRHDVPALLRDALAAVDALLAAGHGDAALPILERARGCFPDDLDVRARIARAHKARADEMVARGERGMDLRFELEESKRAALDVLAGDPDSLAALRVLAEVHMTLDERDAALADGEEIVRRYPNEPAGHLVVGEVQCQRLRELHGEAARTADAARQKKLRELIADARARAEHALKIAAVLTPEQPFPHVQLGHMYAVEGESERATEEYQEALALDPTCAVDHDWLARNLSPDQRADVYRSAAATYRARPGANPRRVALLDWYQAYALLESSAFRAAARLFTAAVEANPGYLNAHCYAMVAAYRDRTEDLAETSAARYAAQAPNHFADTVRQMSNKAEVVAILEYLAQRSASGDRLQRSRDISLVLAKLLETERHWSNYAFLCSATGKFEDALLAYEAALELAPDSPRLLVDIGVLLREHLPSEDNLLRAEQYFRRALVAAKAVLDSADATPQAQSDARDAMNNARRNLEAGKDKN